MSGWVLRTLPYCTSGNADKLSLTLTNMTVTLRDVIDHAVLEDTSKPGYAAFFKSAVRDHPNFSGPKSGRQPTVVRIKDDDHFTPDWQDACDPPGAVALQPS